MPAVTASHLRVLMASGDVTASGYADRRGVPAYFPASAFAELMALRGDAGARELLRSAHCEELVGGELDVDAVEDLERARELFG
jgi:molybdenum cofactor cytidylyltransferase